jgi:hypothetical protein
MLQLIVIFVSPRISITKSCFKFASNVTNIKISRSRNNENVIVQSCQLR